jgi:hypothetical protein
MSEHPTIDELRIADDPAAWRAVGFEFEGDVCAVGDVRLRFGGRGPVRGIVSWSLRGAASLDLDGLRTHRSDAAPPAAAAHPNGVASIDHVVVLTPALERTVASLRGAGLELRRLREGATPGGSERQAFFRVGEPIVEVVQAPPASKVAGDPNGPARLWGISFLVEELDRTAQVLGGLLGEPRAAVQRGRRIATLSPEAGLGPAIAFMTPGKGAI